MNYAFLAGTIAAALVASAPSRAQQVTTKDQLIGTWQVETLTLTRGGEATHPLGEHPSGYVTFTPERMWLLFVDSSRKMPASPTLSDAEAVTMMKTQVAWTGKYTVGEQTPDGIKITAHVDTASSQAIVGNDRVYFVRVEGDKITFKSPGVVEPMTGKFTPLEFTMTRSQ